MAKQAADDLGIGENLLYRWRKEVDTNAADQTVRITDAKGKPNDLRVVNVLLPTGTTEKLITNTHDLSPEDLKEIYNLRWGIEKKYLELKERLKIESFTGSRIEIILQYFYATIVVSNLVSLAKWESQALNDELAPEKQKSMSTK